MDELSISYSNLKEIIVNSSIGGTFDIEMLKKVYCLHINSTRTYCQINDLNALITILEKRDVVDAENVDALEDFFNALNLSSEALNKHKLLIDHNMPGANNIRQPLSDVNHSWRMPDCESFSKNLGEASFPTSTSKTDTANRQNKLLDKDVNHSWRMPDCESFSKNSSESSFPTSTSKTDTVNRQSKLHDKVVSAVASQIGYSWKPLARYLGDSIIPEGIVEKIDEDQSIKTNERRARLMLAEYERNVIPSELYPRLLTALKSSKRMDLYEQVTKILMDARL